MKGYLQAIGGGALSGLLLALALPPLDYWWLGPLCLVPVLAAVAGTGFLRGFLGGIATPLTAALLVDRGLLYRISGGEEGGSGWVFVGFGFFGFAISIVCSISGEMKLRGWRRVFILASLAVVLEYCLFPILPAHLGLTQYRMAGMLMLASIGGIWLVSFLLWAANLAIAQGLREKKLNVPSYILLGYALICLWPKSAQTGGTAVAAIQTQAVELNDLARINLEAGFKGAELAVWPEFSALAVAPGGDTRQLRELSALPSHPAFVTTFRDDFQPIPHNAAALFSGGKESRFYFKRRPFGSETKMHAAGTQAVAVPWNGHPSVGLNICYDSCYAGIMRETAGLHAGVIALPTIDPDATGCFIAAAHSAFTPFRAAEDGVPIIRADGISYSQIVDNTGRIVAEMGARKEGALVARVPLERRWTLFSVLGDWALYLCGAYVLFEIGRGVRGRFMRTAGGT